MRAVQVGVGGGLQVSGEHGAQRAGDEEQRHASAYLAGLVPGSDHVDHTRETAALEETHEKAHGVNCVHVLCPCHSKCCEAPSYFEGGKDTIYRVAGEVIACWDHGSAVGGPEYDRDVVQLISVEV